MRKNDINVLLVEDDQTLGSVLSEAITRAGFKVTLAVRPDDALSLAKIKPVHVAVIDCMLPKMNGVMLAEKLRKESFSTGPLIFISGVYKDKSFSHDALKKTNGTEFLTKPFPAEQLIGIIE